MTGTPSSRSGSVAKTRKSGGEWTWTTPNRSRAVEPDGRPHRPDEERQVLGDVDDDARALVALDVEVADAHAVDHRLDRVIGCVAGR